MKKSLLLIASLLVCVNTILADVTFTVNVPSGTKQCYVVGGLPQLSAWSAGAAVPMKKVEERDQFTVTIAGISTADVSASEGYKYICGPDWKYVEKSASGEKISKEETVFLNILYERLNNTALAYDYEEGKKVSLNIVEAKIKRKVQLKDGKPSFKIMIKLKADIAEINGGVSSKMETEEINRISKSGESFVKNETDKLIYKMYNGYNSDAVGFGRLIYINETEFFKKNEKNLDSILQNSNYEVEVSLKIRRIGQEFIT